MNETFSPARRRTLGMLAGAAALPAAWPVRAQTAKVAFGYTASSDFATLFVAREEGYFSRRGLEVEPKFIPLNPSIPAAIQSDSLQMGGPTPTTFLQAVEGGLDHVVLTGGGLTSKSLTSAGLVARSGSGVKTAVDCVGKKIGVPGLGALLHVSFRVWLKQQGVDSAKVTFIEAPFPQHGDLLRGGSLDAVVTADPFMARIIGTGAGYVASYFATFLPDGLPTLLYVARRDWVQANPAQARAFREAIVEAAAFVGNRKNDARVRQHIGTYIKLPPEVLATIQYGPPGAIVSVKQLAWWADAMQDQKLLRARPDLGKLIVA